MPNPKDRLSTPKIKYHTHSNDLTKGLYWKCELQVLTTMYEDNFPACRIAEVLNRDEAQVRIKIKKLEKDGLI